MAIDDELARLSYVLGSLRAARGEEGEMPPPRATLAAWERILNELDAYLDQAPCSTPTLQLVRAKVTVETELDIESRVWRFPGHLTSRVRSRVAYMEQRIEGGRAGLEKIPAGDDSPLATWPVEPVQLTSEFGWRRDPFHGGARFHYGIDLRAGFGQLVVSAGQGVVDWADWNGGHGRHVEIHHPGGWVTRYSHLAKLFVEAGDEVEAGDPIGLAGDTGRATGPHLHFEIWRDGAVLDPLEVLGEPPMHLTNSFSGESLLSLLFED